MPTVEKVYKVDQRGTGGQDYAQPLPGESQPKSAGSTAYTMQDLGEHAARMGSDVIFDRRGDVVWIDTFEDSLKWVDLIGIAPVLTPTNAFHGSSCMRKRVTLGGGYEQAAVVIPRLMTNRVGGEYTLLIDSFTIGDILGFTDHVFQLDMITPNYAHAIRIRYVNAGNLLQYWNAAGAWATFGTYYLDSTRMHTLKLVANPPDRQYERLIIDGQTWDLRGRQYPRVASGFGANSNGAYLAIGGTNVSAITNMAIYVDCFILTQNEPAGGS